MSKNKPAPPSVRKARPQHDFIVASGQTEGGLLAYLRGYALREKSRTSIKQLLADRYISVNQEATTRWDYPLREGDCVSLHPSPLPAALTHKLVEILWQDEHLILLHKQAGIPTVASGQERDETLMQIVSHHLKKFNPRAKVYLLNRIDKDCAGFVLMAKSETLQQEMTEQWAELVRLQSFACVIEGHTEGSGYLAPPSGEGQRAKNTRPSPKHRSTGAEQAGQARYTTVASGQNRSLLKIELLSGRNNRLRRQFAEQKRPIVGDWRSGSSLRSLGYVALESLCFEFVHPITRQTHKAEQNIPPKFRQLLRTP